MTQSAPKTSSLGDTTAAQRLNPQRFVLDNGIVLLVTPNPTADIVAARLFLQAGLRRETPDDWGLSHLVASVITKGTQSHSASEIAHIVESAGASLGTDSSPDYFLVSLKTVSEDFETVLAVAAEILRSPTFPERELETERKVTLQAIKNRAEQPLSLCLRPLRTALHGDHPYSQTSYGVQETVESLQVNDLHRFHQQYFNPAEMVVSIAGNITPEQAKTLVSQYFGGWNSDHASASDQTARVSQPLSSLQVLTEAQDTQQTMIALGYPAVSVHHPDHIGMKLLMTYLCSGMSSRLFAELREKQSLAYEVSGFYPTRQESSHFVTYLGTTPQNSQRAVDQMRSELERLAEGAMTDEDLAIAKRKWTGQYALGKQTNRQIAQIFGWYETIGLGYDYERLFLDKMQAFPLEQVQRVAATYLRHPVCSVVGPAESIQFAEELV